MRVKYVNPKKLGPLPELRRRFYDQSNYSYLKRVIGVEGYNPAFPVRIIEDEVFDGIHRTKVAQDLDIPKIPVLDYTGILTREEAIGEGIKSNETHATYNPIDKAVHLKKLGESLSRRRKVKSLGRPATLNLALISEVTKMDEKLISHYVNLLRLHESVQKLIGEGKLRSSIASLLLRLDKTTHKDEIPKLAEKIVAEGWSYRKVVSVVEAIKKKGRYEGEAKVCVGCGRAFSTDRMSKSWLCAECNDSLHSGKSKATSNREKMRQRFLKLNNYVQKLEKQGEEVPDWLRERVEWLHQEWKNARRW